jgi:NTP pyrophosphatase (non-canonical NTP hydrolase)
MNTESTAMSAIYREIARATTLHPYWPQDQIHAAAVIAEEAGEVVKAVLDETYEDGPEDAATTEAVHCAATCVRFIMHRLAMGGAR